MDSATIDSLNATKTMHYLITPYRDWDAFKLGVIDDKGNQKKIATTSREKTAFNLFHKMILKLRKYLERTPGYNKNLRAWNAGDDLAGVRVPGGAVSQWNVANKAALGVVAAAYHTMRECVETNTVDAIEIAVKFDAVYESITSEDIMLFEDGVAGTGIAISPTTAEPAQNPVVKKKKKPMVAMVRRNAV